MIRHPTRFLPSAFAALFIGLVFVIPFSIAAIEITFPLLLVVWMLAHRWPWNRGILSRLSREEQITLFALGIHVILCTASLTYSGSLYTTARGLVGKLYEYALLFIIGLFAARSPSAPRGCIRALQWAAGLVVAHSLLQEWAIHRVLYTTVRDPLLSGRTLDYLRMVGPYKNPNDLATYLMVVALLLISLAFHPNRRVSPSQILLLVLVLGCLVWVQSLGAFLGLWVGIGILLFFSGRKKRFVLALGGITAVATVLFLYLARNNLREILTLSDIASKDRMTMWDAAWAMIRAKPIFGLGYNTFMANYGAFVSDHNVWPSYAHNCYLQMAAEIGWVGLLSFLGFLFCFLRTCARALRAAERNPSAESPTVPLLLGLFSGLSAFLVQSAFDTNFYALRQAVLFWTLAGLAAGLSGSLLKKTE